MEYMGFDEIVNAVGGKIILNGKYSGYKNVCTDTRKLERGDIYIFISAVFSI